MPRVILILALTLCCSRLGAQENIRQVDFKNFTYPISGQFLEHSSLQWLDASTANTNRKPIKLVDGKHLTKISSFVMDGNEYAQYEGFTFESVRYANLTGDGNEEAIVHLMYHSGGTQTTDYVYIYTLDQHRPKLLAYCHTGSRAYSGLYDVYGKRGLLVFELLDPAKRQGDCCSSGVLISRYKWQSGVFKQIGPTERRVIPPPQEHSVKPGKLPGVPPSASELGSPAHLFAGVEKEDRVVVSRVKTREKESHGRRLAKLTESPAPNMQIVQTVFGVFHHFELARELDRRGHLRRVYSTWPWARLKREGLPHEKVETFPWLHVPEYLAGRAPIDLTWLTDHLGYANAVSFDRWTEHRLVRELKRTGSKNKIDALIGISGSSLRAGALVQRSGGIFLCDRGSTHQRFQEQILADEFRRWGVDTPPSDPRDTRREEAIYQQADAITVPSTMAARSFVEMGVSAEKLHVIPYGVRLESFQPTADPPTNSFDVLFAGAVGLRKGVPYLLEAFAQLRHPNKRLRLVGAIQEDIRSILPRLPTANVELLGTIPQPELAALMSRSHVLALPSIEEGLALVQAQAMACGCPVLCSTNTGGEDLFTDGVEGFIVPIRDPAALADRLQRLADDPNLQRSMRASALQRVHSIGGWTEYGNRWERLLTHLLTPKQTADPVQNPAL